MRIKQLLLSILICGLLENSGSAEQYDILIRNGTVFDGSGAEGTKAAVAIRGDKVVAVGSLGSARGRREIDATGMAVAPGFINMLSWATDTLIVDGHSQSDIRQGVTLEVFGEGISMGPLNLAMKKEMTEQQGDIRFDIRWTTLAEYLSYLEKKGVSPNIASFIGATTIRIHVLGYDDRAPDAKELEQMKALVRNEMRNGALGIGSSLIYAPAAYAKTEELIALAKVVAEYGGMYISHIRGEGSTLIEAVDEIIRIAREADIRAEIYHIKASGEPNWHKMDEVIRKVEAARAEGLQITADMYLYPASATGLDAAMPAWVQEGGHEAWVANLKNPKIRERLLKEMPEEWAKAGRSGDKTLLISFKNPLLKNLQGKSLEKVAKQRGKTSYETAMDLVIEDDSRVGVVYFSMSEENVRKEVAQPWVSFGSDAESLKPEGVFLKSNVHPRAYGNFARLLGKYVREEKIVSLPEAIRRLTSFPASNLKLDRRGFLRPGYFADIVVFDPATIKDHATFEKPHQFSTGVKHVLVNGVLVLENGNHTGAIPGRFLKPRTAN